MLTIEQVRSNYPEFNDLTDSQLTEVLKDLQVLATLALNSYFAAKKDTQNKPQLNNTC
jgi:hypothetical protein